MPRRGRNTICHHADAAHDAIQRCLYHLKEIDDTYSGVKKLEADDNIEDIDFIPVDPNQPYGKFREYIAGLVEIATELQDMVLEIKNF